MGTLVVVRKTPKGFRRRPLFITVSKAVSKKATERNKIKRRIRAIMREITGKNVYDISVIAKKELVKASFGELKKEIEKELQHGNAI